MRAERVAGGLQRAGAAAVLALVAVVGTLAALGAPAAAAPGRPGLPGEVPEGRRVLVFAVPGLTWADVNDGPVPVLRDLLDGSGVASVALRVISMRTQPGEGYATIGAGTRAVAARSLAGMAYGGDSPWGRGTVAEEVARQRGAPVEGEVFSVVWRQLQVQNDRSDFEAELGTLGEALEAAGIARGVIANADADDPLAGRDGAVPCGNVERGLLVESVDAPFGVRLDHDVVVEEFRRCSVPGSVVLVEASDLRRAEDFGRRLGRARAAEVRAEALRSADELLERLLGELDLARDAVVVVSPSAPGEPRLGVLGIHATEVRPALLVSGSTRQPGYVTLADVTPTIAELAGVPIDEGALEGRAVELARTGGTAVERRLGLEEDDAVARFRDRMITPVAAAYITGVCLLAVAAVLVLARWPRSRALELAALCLLGVTPVTYLARLLPFHEWGPSAYWLFLVAGVAVLGLAYWSLRRWWLAPLAAAYGLVVGVIVVNVALLGSNLQLGAVFGDSAIVAGRFSGVNNVMFAQLIVAATALASVAASRLSGAVARLVVAVVLAGIAFVIAAPMWGADVGGALAGIPTLALVGTRLTGLRIRWRTVLLWGAAAVAVVVAFGLFDMARPSAEQSHLGRLFERIQSEGFEGFRTVVERKLATNLRTLTGSVWRFILGPVIVAIVVAVWRAPGRFRRLVDAFWPAAAVAPGVVCGLVLGYALNDSGIAVPGMMLAVAVPAIVYLLSRIEAPDLLGGAGLAGEGAARSGEAAGTSGQGAPGGGDGGDPGGAGSGDGAPRRGLRARSGP